MWYTINPHKLKQKSNQYFFKNLQNLVFSLSSSWYERELTIRMYLNSCDPLRNKNGKTEKKGKIVQHVSQKSKIEKPISLLGVRSRGKKNFKVKVLSCSVMSHSLWPHGLSMEFSRQQYWSGLPFPSPGDLPDSGIEPRSPAMQTVYYLSYQGTPKRTGDFQLLSLYHFIFHLLALVFPTPFVASQV